MADPNTRQGKRTPVTLKIKFKSETLEQFIERYAVDVSQGGIFIRTKEPLAVGTQMKFEFQLRDASPLISGEGTVVWTRENDPSRPAIAPGMGVRFDRLNDGSQQVLEKILAEKAKQAPQRGTTETTKPPMFTDTPTRVAPAPLQDGLALGPPGRSRQDSGQTPLPNPMPFHSDADDFDENAFQEATKVRSLDELVAATASDQKSETVVMPADELAARRSGSARPETPLAEPPLPGDGHDDRSETIPDRESAPALPSPPESEAARPKLLDTSPSPRSEPAGEAAKTKLGLEPAKAETAPRSEPAEDKASAKASAKASQKIDAPRPIAAASETSRPIAPKRPSIAPIVIGVLVLVAAAAAAVYWFVIKPGQTEDEIATTAPHGGSGSAAPTPGSGSALATPGSGSAAAMNETGSGSAATAPAGPTVDTVVSVNAPKATVEVDDTGESGPAPFTAKLEKGKAYKVHVTAPGFVAADLDVKGGQAKLAAKLQPKPRVLHVTSEPAGALVYIDGAPTGKTTPADITLTAAQAARTKVNVLLRKAGYRANDQVIETASFSEADDKLTGSVEAKLAVYVPPVNNGGNHPHPGSGSGSAAGAGSGSATPAGTGSGSGSGTGTGTGTGGDTGTGAGTGSAATPTPPAPPPPAGSAAGAEPEPDFSNKP